MFCIAAFIGRNSGGVLVHGQKRRIIGIAATGLN